MSILNLKPEDLMRQASMTSEEYLINALSTVDKYYSCDVAESEKAVVISSLVTASALDFLASQIACLNEKLCETILTTKE